MGAIPSSSSQSNPSSTTTATSNPTMTSENSSLTPQSKLEQEPANAPETEIPIVETPDPPTGTRITDSKENPAEQESIKDHTTEEGEEGEEEEGECGFCLFMKAGGCKDTFTDWEKCVEEGEKNKEDIVEKCYQATAALKKCMEAHSDYYAPLLRAEEEAVKQLEEEKEKLDSQGRGSEESGKEKKEEALDGSEKKETS